MPARIDRVNRTLLILLGLLLVLAGAAALAAGLGAFGADAKTRAVLSVQISRFIADNPWFWWAVAGAAVIVALLVLRWLIGQLHTTGLGHLDVEPDRSGGETVLRAGAIADGVEQEVQGYVGVRRAGLRLVGTASSHRHHLTVDLDDRADIDAVRTRLVTRTVPNMRRALDFDDPAIDIRIVLAPRQRRRVR